MARSKQTGEQCKNTAMPGKTVCRFHGGLSSGPPKGSKNALRTGAHETILEATMTPEERANPKLMNPSRKRRIAKGAGVDISEVNRFIKQFEQSRKMMKKMPGMMGGKKGRMKFPF